MGSFQSAARCCCGGSRLWCRQGLWGGRTLPQGNVTDSSQADSHLEDDAKNKHPEDLAEVMDFSRYDLFTTVRLIVCSGESRKIQVKKGSRKGSMFIKEGEIYCVETDDRYGDEAFFEIVSWKNASHTDVQEADPPEKNVRISTNVLLDLMKSRTQRSE